MKTHTPGPWTADYGDFAAYCDTGAEVCEASAGVRDDGTRIPCDEMEANLNLIAAAPDLLAACKCALADLEGILPDFDPEGHPEWSGEGEGHSGWQTIAQLMAAIAKAEGRGQKTR